MDRNSWTKITEYLSQLRKYHPTADFPPKRVRNTTTKVLEARRSGLEVWLHSALQIQPMPAQLLTFLHIHNFQPPQIEQEESSSDSSPSHQPILYYSCDPHLLSRRTSSLPNTVTKGVLTAIYDQNFKLPF
ncbi:sorting nexin-24-like isoform X3 [Oratosquilla oratoria]|uniref:sorting nexin-24-like isoform X3 n=1 Tax=Oratosquilla oratoria TaxID=337810 RepID=UPI003F77246D